MWPESFLLLKGLSLDWECACGERGTGPRNLCCFPGLKQLWRAGKRYTAAPPHTFQFPPEANSDSPGPFQVKDNGMGKRLKTPSLYVL